MERATPAPRQERGTGEHGTNSNGGGRRGRATNGEGLANFLGWFSIGLGLAQIASPRGMARLVGASGDSDSRTVMRAVGVREIAAGVGLLSQSRPAGWAWARVAGDVMDLALLGSTLRSDNREPSRAAGAAAAVAGIAALDVLCARQLSRGAETTAKGTANGGRVGVKQSITVNRPLDEVYGFWRNFENLPRFMQHLELVQTTGERQSHWKAKGPAGTTVEWDAETTEDRPNELIAWRSVGNADVDNAGVVRFTRAAGGRGTEVHVDLRYDPPAGKLGAAIAKLFGEEPNQQVAGDLRRFKQVLETGEVVYSDATIHRGPHPARPPKEPQAPRQDSEPDLVVERSADAAVSTSSNLDRSSTGARGRDHEARA
jgi:uncharacterized membrane protein